MLKPLDRLKALSGVDGDETRSGLPFCPGFCVHHSAFVIPTGLAYFPASSPWSFLSASAAHLRTVPSWSRSAAISGSTARMSAL